MTEAASTLADSDAGRLWIAQFAPADQALAKTLLDSMLLVRAEAFIEQLRQVTVEAAASVAGPVGLYAERELPKYFGRPPQLFKQQRVHGRMRAYGPGPRPVEAMRTIDPEIGSEGLVATLITELCREQRAKFLSHPGPDQIREKKVRSFFLLTDFVGSGQRVLNYLQAAWRVASVASWWSSKLLHFEVLAYSTTELGRKAVQSHASKPELRIVAPCPTIDSRLDADTARRMRLLCRDYDPVDHDPTDSLGFGGCGALIAFAHSCPNNAPRILYKKGRRWAPLFPSRVTAGTRALFGARLDDEAIKNRLKQLGQHQLAKGNWLPLTGSEGRQMILLLAAIRRGPRFDEAVARKTGLTLLEIRKFAGRARKLGWITEGRHLTDSGLSQLVSMRGRRILRKATLPGEPAEPYYPKSLRAPRQPV